MRWYGMVDRIAGEGVRVWVWAERQDGAGCWR